MKPMEVEIVLILAEVRAPGGRWSYDKLARELSRRTGRDVYPTSVGRSIKVLKARGVVDDELGLRVVPERAVQIARDYSHHPGVEESCSRVLSLFGIRGDEK